MMGHRAAALRKEECLSGAHKAEISATQGLRQQTKFSAQVSMELSASHQRERAALWKVPLIRGTELEPVSRDWLGAVRPHPCFFPTLHQTSDPAHSLYYLWGGMRKEDLRDDVIMKQGPLRTKANFREHEKTRSMS